MRGAAMGARGLGALSQWNALSAGLGLTSGDCWEVEVPDEAPLSHLNAERVTAANPPPPDELASKCSAVSPGGGGLTTS